MDRKILSTEMVDIVGGELSGNGDIYITGVAALKDATQEEISFLANKKYKDQVAASSAGTVIVGRDFDCEIEADRAIIFCDDPNSAFSKAIAVFAPKAIEFPKGIAPSAVVAESAEIGQGVSVGPNAVIDENVVIGSGTVIGAGSYIGQYCKVGDDCLVYPNVSIRERTILGNRVIIHCGTTIGSDGFGFAPGPQGILKIPQVGIVQIDDDVEIGANCAIDRARFGKTWLKRGVKLDNIVHIAHNVVVGEWSMLIGQCGIAGSTEIGSGVIIAAQAGINGHIKIGDGAQVAGASGVIKNIGPMEKVVGLPAESPRAFMERVSLPKKVKKLQLKLKALEAEVKELNS